jgi:excisionase family DNA binding protein
MLARLFLSRRCYVERQMNTTQAPIGALKLKDAAKYLGGVSTITVRRLIDRGLLKPNRSLRHLLIPVSQLDRFLEEGQQ